jgi:hypothetical protein
MYLYLPWAEDLDAREQLWQGFMGQIVCGFENFVLVLLSSDRWYFAVGSPRGQNQTIATDPGCWPLKKLADGTGLKGLLTLLFEGEDAKSQNAGSFA